MNTPPIFGPVPRRPYRHPPSDLPSPPQSRSPSLFEVDILWAGPSEPSAEHSQRWDPARNTASTWWQPVALGMLGFGASVWLALLTARVKALEKMNLVS